MHVPLYSFCDNVFGSDSEDVTHTYHNKAAPCYRGNKRLNRIPIPIDFSLIIMKIWCNVANVAYPTQKTIVNRFSKDIRSSKISNRAICFIEYTYKAVKTS